MIAPSMRRSSASKPSASTLSICIAASATERVMVPSALTWA
jgi:hypothetical protein